MSDVSAEIVGPQYQNGNLPRSVLAPVPGGWLRRDAAAAFNAMNRESQRQFNLTLCAEGPRGSYRTLAQQEYLWRLYQERRGNLAAHPGTSNHGLGLAIDLGTHEMRSVLDQIGSPFGWSKSWSDAPTEWWHIKYRPGVWRGAAAADAGTRPRRSAATDRGADAAPTGGATRGGRSVTRGPRPDAATAVVQQLLRARGFDAVVVDGIASAGTRAALTEFQRLHDLRPTGVLDRATATALRDPSHDGVRRMAGMDDGSGPGPVGVPVDHIRMFDSVTISEIPPSATAVAGYIDGKYTTFPALCEAFGSGLKLAITVDGNVADCLDIEKGNLVEPSQAGGWVRAMLARGRWRPCIYANLSTMPAVIPSLGGIERSRYRLWVADYTGVPHIPPGFDACQWTDKAAGRNLDESLCHASFFPGFDVDRAQWASRR